jgi:hypothetical protein
MHRFILGLTLLSCALLTGCGPAHSRVHGTVNFQGQPLARGTIIFLAADNRAYPVKIKADGSYEIAELPRGFIKVSLLAAEERRPPLRGAPGANEDDDFAKAKAEQDNAAKKGPRLPPPASAVTLPTQYGDPESSGLSFELGLDREYSVDLK